MAMENWAKQAEQMSTLPPLSSVPKISHQRLSLFK
jgi:hypothetical protein